MKRVILTHYHPDHAGNADWLCRRFGVELWTTQGEYLTAHAVRESRRGLHQRGGARRIPLQRPRCQGRVRAMTSNRNRYAELVPEFPHSYRRIIEADRVRVGAHDWRAIIGHGHAPEHLSLYCEALNVVIAGDMLLSTISTNVSVWSIDPEGDPLRLFLDSIRRYRELPADVLVLPSHGKPFRGAHDRVADLEEHHRTRFAALKRELAGGERRRRRSAASALSSAARRAPDFLRNGRGDSPSALPLLRRGSKALPPALMASCGMQPANPTESAELARVAQSVAERSSRILGDVVQKQGEMLSSVMRDELGIGKAFMDLYCEHAGQPDAARDADQMNLWSDYMSLWQSTWMKLLRRGDAAGRRAGQGRQALQGRGAGRSTFCSTTSSSRT